MQFPDAINQNQGNFSCWDLPAKAVHYFCKPFTFAIHIIKSTNQYVESSSFPAKFVLRFAFGAAIGCAQIPLALSIVTIADLTIGKIIGQMKWDSLHQEMPLYDGKEIGFLEGAVIAPILEELICRWFIHYSIKIPVKFVASYFYPEKTAKKVGEVSAIILTSISFGLLHASNSKSFLVALPQVINCAVGGIILGCEKEYGGGITMSIADHMMNNTIAILLIKILSDKK